MSEFVRAAFVVAGLGLAAFAFVLVFGGPPSTRDDIVGAFIESGALLVAMPPLGLLAGYPLGLALSRRGRA